MTEPASQSGVPSLESTRDLVLTEAERRGWREVDRRWLKAMDFSDTGLDQPGLAGAVDGLRQRRTRALVIAKAEDTEGSLLDVPRLMDAATRASWALVALYVDHPTQTGHVVIATFAPYDRRRNAERTRAVIAARKARGLPVGRRSSLPKEVLDRIVAERRAGASLYAIKDGLNADGIKGASGGYWYASTVRHALLKAETERP